MFLNFLHCFKVEVKIITKDYLKPLNNILFVIVNVNQGRFVIKK